VAGAGAPGGHCGGQGPGAEDASIGVRLLADIKVVMDGKERLSSADLCTALNKLEESGWGGWNDGKGIGQRDLAKRLNRYGVKPKVHKLSDGSTPRGYLHSEFLDPFARYLRDATPLGTATSATSATQIRIQVAEVAEVALGRGVDGSSGAISSNGDPRLRVGGVDPAIARLREMVAINERGTR
jgi:Protein of unknown function (DUF3631)